MRASNSGTARKCKDRQRFGCDELGWDVIGLEDQKLTEIADGHTHILAASES